MTTQPVCLARPLCKVPPEQPEGAKEAATDKNDETKENLSKSQDAETQIKDKDLPEETERLAKENAESRPSAANNDSAGEKGSGKKKQDDKKTSSQKKLHDLLSSLASVRIYLDLHE